jgi:hypothetical protein
MADDPVAVELARLRECMTQTASALAPSLDAAQAYVAGALHGDALKALAGIDAVLAVHRLRHAFGRQVCAHCTDAGGGTLLVAWPCRTRKAILAALTGKENDSGN